MQYRTAAVVRRNRQIVSLGHDRDFLRFRDSAAPTNVRHDDARRAVLQQLAEPEARHQPFAQTQRQARGAGQFTVGGQVVLRQHLFQPHGRIRLQCLGDADGARQVPVAVKLHGHFHRVAELFANQPQGLDPPAQLVGGDVLASSFLSDRIERPDLHRVDSEFRQFARQPRGLRQKIDMVVAGVVSADRRARCAAEQLVYRHVRHFSGQVPERDIHRADGAHLGARPAAKRNRLEHIRPQPVDLRRIAPQ